MDERTIDDRGEDLGIVWLHPIHGSRVSVQKDEISLDGGAVTAVEADGGDKTIIVSRTARSATIRRFEF